MGSHCPPRARGRASCRAGPGTGTAEGGSPVASTLLPALPSPAPPRSGPRPAPRAPPRPRQVETARLAAARSVSRALPTAAGSTAAGRTPTTPFRGRCLPGDSARSPRSRSCSEPSSPPPSGSARTDQDCLRPREATPADARPPGRSEPRRQPVSECVTQAASPPMSLSHPQPKFPPVRAGAGLGRLKGCEDNLGH